MDQMQIVIALHVQRPGTPKLVVRDEFEDATATRIEAGELCVYSVAVFNETAGMDAFGMATLVLHTPLMAAPPGFVGTYTHPSEISDEGLREEAFDLWTGAFKLEDGQRVWSLGVPYVLASLERDPEDAGPYTGKALLRRLHGHQGAPSRVSLELVETTAPTRHGLYEIVESFATPKGELVYLAYNESASEPWATGVYMSIGGATYYRDGVKAREDFAKRIAHSLGLKVGGPKSLVVHEGKLSVLAFNAMELQHQIERVQEDTEDHEQLSALFEMTEAGAANWVKLINEDPEPLERTPQPPIGATVGMNAAEFIAAVYHGANSNREDNS